MEIFAAYSGTSEADVSKPTVFAIEAGSIFTPVEKLSPGRLLIEGTTIVGMGRPESVRIPAGAEIIDATPFIVTPGFIDPHIHGCGGVDVMECTAESLNAVCRILVRHGTTSFLPTTVSSPPDVLTRAVERLALAIPECHGGAVPLGIHLEGPFLNVAKRGTHKVANLSIVDIGLLERCVRLSRNTIRLLTIAPELEGADLLMTAAERVLGLTIAMGHSNATFSEAKTAVDRGVCYAVHTFNAMRAFSHRDPGIIGEVLADDRVFAEIIADGVHVDASVVRVFARAKGVRRVLLVTDATSATDMPDGRYTLGEDVVKVVNGICRDTDGHLAGSTLTQEVALRNFMEWTEWPLEDALPALTLNPATALKLKDKGILQEGADADVVILDKNFRVMKTFVAGRLVFDRSSSVG
jgi:N-acetylglucosamine-6-phosphate deacetylase